ncbi:MerR family transcriptional regulator [Streptomyces sp. ODS28]|uniref:MerR family transcriptional regulator n=1 Tax=Streptomyces sp. ODS28 TaxID=3136688 RepID=UPI0031ED1AD5
MRLSELSEQSGVPTATIKYYLREGLLPPGERVTATTSSYDEAHLRRLRLVRALIQVGRLPVATVREVLAHADNEELGRTMRLGAALWELPSAPEPELPAADYARAEEVVAQLLARLGWSSAQELAALSPSHRSLVVALATLTGLGYPFPDERLVPYAELMHQAASMDLDFMETLPGEAAKVEGALVGTVLFEPVLTALRRLAQEEESVRRYGV